MSKPSLSLCAWGYNEEELIEEFVKKSDEDLRAVTDDYEIIVVDDASTDSTWEKMVRLEKEYPHLRIVRHEVNKDVGYGFHSTIPLATKDFIFWNTVDMFHDTKDLPQYMQHFDSYDLIQGVRRNLKANTWSRKLTTWVNYNLIRCLFQIPMSEFQNVKFIRRTFMEQIQLESGSIFTNPEIGIKAYYLGARIKEVEMDFCQRQKGKQKGARFQSLCKTFRDIMKCWFRWIVCRKIKRVETLSPIDCVPAKRW